MPTYEYQCKSCEHRFDRFQSMMDSSLRKCPKCGKNTLERLIGTGAALIFKGSGFYQTDYRSESYKKSAEADSSAGKSAEKTDKPGEVKADGKPESKPAADKPAAAPSEAPAKPATESKPIRASKSAKKRTH